MKTLKLEVGWFIHNMIGHPLFELIYLFGCGWYFPRVERFARRVHDATLPVHDHFITPEEAQAILVDRHHYAPRSYWGDIVLVYTGPAPEHVGRKDVWWVEYLLPDNRRETVWVDDLTELGLLVSACSYDWAK